MSVTYTNPYRVEETTTLSLATDQRDTDPGKTIYVIAAYSGNRRDNYLPYLNDRTHYLKLHFKKLSQLQHRLNKILIVAPWDENPKNEFERYLASEYPKTVGTANVSVLRRNNIGMSYGSYSDSFKSETEAARKWDWWILMEDDNIPVLDHFDSILKNCFRRKPNCGALWGHISQAERHPSNPWPDYFPVAGCHSCGITTGPIMDEVWKERGLLPHFTPGERYEGADQVEFTRAFMVGGRNIEGLNHEYQVGMMYFHGSVVFRNDPGLPLIFAPLQRPELCGFEG